MSASRNEARDLIDAGVVRVGGVVADKASRQVLPGDAIVVAERPRYVGRGAHKLIGALDTFGVDPAGKRCLDVGASTGGFTQVLLERGADHVTALDVGHGQLHERVAADARVWVVERTNMRHVAPGQLGDRFDLVVVDVSFISLRVLLAPIAGQLADDGTLVALVKPQFEVGRREASRGRGVITDPALWTGVLAEVIDAGADVGLVTLDVVPSPITGGDGNVEFLARMRSRVAVSSGHGSPPDEAMVAAAVTAAQAVTLTL